MCNVTEFQRSNPQKIPNSASQRTCTKTFCEDAQFVRINTDFKVAFFNGISRKRMFPVDCAFRHPLAATELEGICPVKQPMRSDMNEMKPGRDSTQLQTLDFRTDGKSSLSNWMWSEHVFIHHPTQTFIRFGMHDQIALNNDRPTINILNPFPFAHCRVIDRLVTSHVCGFHLGLNENRT